MAFQERALDLKSFLVRYGEFRARFSGSRYVIEYRLMVPVEFETELRAALAQLPGDYHPYWSINEKWASATFSRNADLSALCRSLRKGGEFDMPGAEAKPRHRRERRWKIAEQWMEAADLRRCEQIDPTTKRAVYNRAEFLKLRTRAIADVKAARSDIGEVRANRILYQWPKVKWTDAS